MKTILIVEDDVSIGDMLSRALGLEGYGVARAYSGSEAAMAVRRARPDLILLDLMLPGLSGEELLPTLAGIPVIVVSARAGVEDKVSLLLAGAADYIAKPFDLRELLARVAVRLRPASAAPSRICAAGLTLDTDTRLVSHLSQSVRLTPTEYAILKLLLSAPGRVITRSRLLDLISADTPDCTEDSLKVHLSNLRRKLRQIGSGDPIESVWGVGFRLREDPLNSPPLS